MILSRRKPRDYSGLGIIDYLLMAIGASLAVHSAGMGVAQPELGRFFLVVIACGTLFSYAIRMVAGQGPLIRADGFLYAGAAAAAVFLAAPLNQLLPDEGFPRDVMMAGVLCWMLSLGSFLTWRDGTLVFQAVPCIALFGLVGCYDTYKNVAYTFFGFLLCLATLFARSQAREMLRQAVASGYFGADAPKEERSELFDKIKAGPWRWMAGPEWALASALAVVLFSFAGAPVLQETVKPISGLVRATPARLRQPPPLPGPTLGVDASGQVQIGRGPNRLRDTPLFDVRMDRLRYLRAAFFDVYNGRGWSSRFDPSEDLAANPEADTPASFAIAEIRDPRQFGFRVKSRGSTRLLPVPGDVYGLESGDAAVRQKPDGSFAVEPPTTVDVTGRSIESASPGGSTKAKLDLPRSLRETTSVERIPPRVAQLAREATTGMPNDRARAEAIARAIGVRVKYNINAGATPEGRDPVEFFLFDQREGYCDVFASSMVLMARVAGMPARYVTGFLPDEDRIDRYGNTILTEADFHAWAELFFEGEGWVIFDATSYAAAVPGGERGATTDSQPWFKRAWFTSLLNALIGVLVIAAVWGGISLVRQKRSSQPGRSELERIYIAFARTLHRYTGRRRQLHESPREYLESVAPSLNGAFDPARHLTEEVERGLFSPAPITPELLAKLRQELGAFEALLRRERKGRS